MAIPPIFHSFLNDAPFRNCVRCACDLEKEQPYAIEKAFNRGEVVFEYALCLNCMIEMQAELSEESQQALDRYFAQVRWEQREAALEDERDLDAWIGYCLIKGTPREELDEYQLCALCEGDNMLYHGMPFLLSGAVAEEIQKLLSRKTRDSMDGFIRDHLNQMPDLDKILTGPIPVIF